MTPRGIREVSEEAALHYQAATGIGCVAVAPDGRRFRSATGSAAETGRIHGCEFCAVLKEIRPERFEDCSGIHRFGTAQAERFGGSYMYFCPRNFTHWASPVRMRGVTVAALVGGPVLMMDYGDYLEEDIRKSGEFDARRVEDLKAAAERIPYVDPRRARSLARVLFMQAQSVSLHLDELPVPAGAGERGDAPERTAGSKTSRKRPSYPVSRERELLSLITRGDLDGSRKTLNEILGFIFFSSNHDLDIIRRRVLELVVLISRAAIEGGAPVEEIMGLNDRYLLQIQTTRSSYDLSAVLAVVLPRFIECVFTLKSVRHADTVQKALRYINARCTGPIGLDDVAYHVDLSASHLSRLLREGTGETYTEILTAARIRAGKELLADPSVPLAEIGPRIGFADQSYFTRVFRNRTGISPGRYRKGKGLEEGTPSIDESDIEIHE